MLSRVRTRVGVGEAGAAEGKVAPAWREYRGAPGRGVRERASLRLPALQRPRQGSGGRAGSRGRAVQVGGLGRLCRLPGPRVCASDPGKARFAPGVACPDGEAETKVARPGPTRGQLRGAARPPRDISERSGNLVRTARRCQPSSPAPVRGESRCRCHQFEWAATSSARLPRSLPSASRPHGSVLPPRFPGSQ